MRIDQIAPLAEAVPPKMYGGTERVVKLHPESCALRSRGLAAAPERISVCHDYGVPNPG
jgi:hypothetical protein